MNGYDRLEASGRSYFFAGANPVASVDPDGLKAIIVAGDLQKPWPDANYIHKTHMIDDRNEKSYLDAVAAAVMTERAKNRSAFNASTNDEFNTFIIRSEREFYLLGALVSESEFDEFYYVGHAVAGRALLSLAQNEILGAQALARFMRAANMKPRVVGLFGCSVAGTDLVNRIFDKGIAGRVLAADGPVTLRVFFRDAGNSPQVERVQLEGGYNVYGSQP